MSESFVTAWEMRDIARRIESDGFIPALLGGAIFPDDDLPPDYAEPQAHIVAVIVEALRCLADTKERRRELRNDPLPLGVSA